MFIKCLKRELVSFCLQSVAGTSLLTRGTMHQPAGTYQLMVDPKLGLMVSPMAQQQPAPGWSGAQVAQKAMAPTTKQNKILKVGGSSRRARISVNKE